MLVIACAFVLGAAAPPGDTIYRAFTAFLGVMSAPRIVLGGPGYVHAWDHPGLWWAIGTTTLASLLLGSYVVTLGGAA